MHVFTYTLVIKVQKKMHGKDKYKVCGSSYSRQGPGPVRARQVLSTELCPWLETIVMLRVLSWDHTRVRRKEKHKIYLYIYQDIVVERWHRVGTLILIAAICDHVSLPGLSPSDRTLAVLSSRPSLSVHGAERVCGLWHPCTHPTSCFSLRRRGLRPISSAELSVSPVANE